MTCEIRWARTSAPEQPPTRGMRPAVTHARTLGTSLAEPMPRRPVPRETTGNAAVRGPTHSTPISRRTTDEETEAGLHPGCEHWRHDWRTPRRTPGETDCS